MSATNFGGPAGANGVWMRQIETNVRAGCTTLCRTPRRPVAWPNWPQIAAIAVLAAVLVVVTMALFDAWAVGHARRLPTALLTAAGRFTNLGKAGWFLWPFGVVLLALAAFDTPKAPRFARLVLAAWTVRLGFVFTAIALPSLFDTIIKRLIGRARPFVDGVDVWSYHLLSWQPKYASFPSGHTATAFAALVAIGTILPQARALLWIYAGLIGLSRVVITAHYPSDVLAGAVIGGGGALLVRHWFAARGLGFMVASDGSIKAMPGPSFRRIIKAVARRLHSA